MDGKERKDAPASAPGPSRTPYIRGVPDYDYKIGTLKFLRNVKPSKEIQQKTPEFKPFQGTSYTLNSS